MKLTIYKKPGDLNRFVDTVRERGDSEREALGFLPRCVYAEAAAQGKLYVATAFTGRQECYVGHVLFGGKFPHLRIFQLYVIPEFRKQDIARRLIERLAADSEGQYYLRMSARVAADLPSNHFWERAGFRIVRIEEGGATTGRRINVRLRELDSPTLFTGDDTSAPAHASVRWERPIYSLDVNVLLDVMKDRPRAEFARKLLKASMSGMLRLFVAAEFVAELTRAVSDAAADPVLCFALSLPQFVKVPELLLDSLKRELADIIFAHPLRNLRTRDHSDLLHLATAIYHSASGFVTSDERILRNRNELRARYGLDVLGPAELAEVYMPSQWTPANLQAQLTDGTRIEVSEMAELQRVDVEAFLRSCGMPAQQIMHALSSGQAARPRHRVIVSFGGNILGFASWDASHTVNVPSESWMTVEPDHPMAEFASDALFQTMSRDVSSVRPASVLLKGDLANREVREGAATHGFKRSIASTGELVFEKFCFGGIITPRNSRVFNEMLGNYIGLSLPDPAPQYAGPGTIVGIGGPQRAKSVRLDEFEAYFGPVMLMLPGRPVVVVPIRRVYSDQLLDSAPQPSLFPRAEAAVRHERLYLSSPRTLSVLTPGAIILFYESKADRQGRGAIVAAARIVRTAMRQATTIDTETVRRGVLSAEEIDSLSVTGQTALTFFDQVMRLDNPVCLRRLRALGCADGANLVTARRIDETAALAIIEEGRPSARLQ